MSTRRFITADTDLTAAFVRVEGDLFRHMVKVLRLKIDTRVNLADGRGTECTGIIKEIGRDHLAIAVEERHAAAPSGGGTTDHPYPGTAKG